MLNTSIFIGALAASAHFSPRRNRHIALLSGEEERRWALEDFTFQHRRRSARAGSDEQGDEPRDPAAHQLDDLTLAFLGVLYREHGISLAKGDMARKSIARYVLDRHAGKLEPDDSPFDFHRRPKGQKTPRRSGSSAQPTQ
jgi:hypothetical protein